MVTSAENTSNGLMGRALLASLGFHLLVDRADSSACLDADLGSDG